MYGIEFRGVAAASRHERQVEKRKIRHVFQKPSHVHGQPAALINVLVRLLSSAVKTHRIEQRPLKKDK